MARSSSQSLDILEGSLWKSIPLFALPVAITGILEQIANVVDVAVIGQFFGDEATLGMAGVGANTALTHLVINLLIGISLGANVVIANAIGRGDREAASNAVHTAILMALVSVPFVVLGEIFAEPVLKLLNVPDETMPYASLYLRVYLIGMPMILLYNFEAAIFRAVGITKMPLQALGISSVLNVVLDILFVAGLGWGIGGVAASTCLCYTTSAGYLLFRLLRTDSEVRVQPSKLRLDMPSLARIVRIGLPAGIQSAVFSIANIVVQSAINSLGTEYMAASSAAQSIETVNYSVLNSFSQACTTFVGQNYGARQLDRCRESLKVAVIEDAVAVGISVLTCLFFGHMLLGIFNGDPRIVQLGFMRLCLIVPAHGFSMLYENMSGYLRGFGISLAPAAITMLGVCGVRLFWIFVVFPQLHSFQWLMAIYPISLGITMLLIFGLLLYCRPSRMHEPAPQRA